MSRRTLRSDDVEGFMLAFWDELRDTVIDYGCDLFVSVHPGVDRGKFTFRGVATRIDEMGDERFVARAEVLWPSHKYTSLHAAVLSLGSKLSLEVMKEHRERTGDWLHGTVKPARPPGT